ncbi:MAG: hypothetical protein WBA30_13680, partial [Priestia megaterium]
MSSFGVLKNTRSIMIAKRMIKAQIFAQKRIKKHGKTAVLTSSILLASCPSPDKKRYDSGDSLKH